MIAGVIVAEAENADLAYALDGLRRGECSTSILEEAENAQRSTPPPGRRPLWAGGNAQRPTKKETSVSHELAA